MHCTHRHRHTHTHTHTHTNTQNHTQSNTYSAVKHTKAFTNMHSKHALSPIHKIGQFLWLLKAKEAVHSSELWARHLCRRFHSDIVRAKAIPWYRHLPNLSICDSWHSPISASRLLLIHGNGVMAFETAVIKDGKRWCTFRQNITEMVGQKVDWPSVPHLEASFFGKVDSNVAHNINASICNA